MIGKKFGTRTIISDAGTRGKRKVKIYVAKCDCGFQVIRCLQTLKKSNCQSCHSKRINTRHGLSKMPIYRVWMGMKTRCFNKKDDGYIWYGARGITVCERWMKFENFFEDMGHKPEGLSIDRIDVNKGYYKENCRWANPQQQTENRRPIIPTGFNLKCIICKKIKYLERHRQINALYCSRKCQSVGNTKQFKSQRVANEKNLE